MATTIVKNERELDTLLLASKATDEKYICIAQKDNSFTEKTEAKAEVITWEVVDKVTGKKAVLYFYPLSGDKPQGFINADALAAK